MSLKMKSWPLMQSNSQVQEIRDSNIMFSQREIQRQRQRQRERAICMFALTLLSFLALGFNALYVSCIFASLA